MICSPRPVSAREPGVCGIGAALLGSATAHSTQGPGWSRPSQTGRWGPVSPGPGEACRSALVSSSDTTSVMSGLRSATPQRCRVATVKSRAARTDPGSEPSRRVAIRGGRVRPTGTGSGAGHRSPFTRPAISAASISQRQPGPAVRCDGCVAIAVWSISSRHGYGRASSWSVAPCPHRFGEVAAWRPPQACRARAEFQGHAARIKVPAGFSTYLPAGMA